MPPVTSRKHFRRIVYQRTMFWWPYYSQLWPLVNSLTENSSFFRIRRHAPGRLSGDRVEPITHQRCRSTNRVTCIMSNASSIMSIVRMICLLQPSSLLFRTLADTSLQRTGLVYSPLRGDMATHQTSGGGRADVFYQIRDALSSNPDNVILTCCFII